MNYQTFNKGKNEKIISHTKFISIISLH